MKALTEEQEVFSATPLDCVSCGKPIKVTDQIHMTFAGVSHDVCEANPYDWCRKRPGEDDATHRERMLANIPEGLKRNIVKPCPIAEYFGLGRQRT